ncbi:MAG: hypothetical protein AAFY88_28845, partial [Acidobacteriota bacterium]
AERLAAARNWVQDEIRYFASVMGPHSHAPHAPADILARRYGDCKDKTSLLLHLLDRLGVEAWPALVNSTSGRGLINRLPSPSVFDHVIVAARLGDRKVFVDPTLSLQGGVEALSVPSYGYALEIRPDTTDLTPVTLPDDAVPSTHAVYTYTSLGDDGAPFHLKIVSTFSGADAESLRHTLASTSLEDLQETYTGFYSSDTHTVSAHRPIDVTDDRDANRVTTVEHYEVTYVDPAGELGFSTLPLLLESDLGYPGELESRATPYGLPFPRKRREVIELETSDIVDYSTREATEDNDYFLFRARTEYEPTTIRLIYDLEVRAPEVAPQDLPEYAQAVDRAWSHLGYAFMAKEARGFATAAGGPGTQVAVADDRGLLRHERVAEVAPGPVHGLRVLG